MKQKLLVKRDENEMEKDTIMKEVSRPITRIMLTFMMTLCTGSASLWAQTYTRYNSQVLSTSTLDGSTVTEIEPDTSSFEAIETDEGANITGFTANGATMLGVRTVVMVEDEQGYPLICAMDSSGNLELCDALLAPYDDPPAYECTGTHCYCNGRWDCFKMWFACKGDTYTCNAIGCDKECASDKPAGKY